MHRFILINEVNNIFLKQIETFFEVEKVKKGKNLIIYLENYPLEDIISTIKALYIDLLLNNIVYISGSKNNLAKEEELISNNLDKLDNGIYLAPQILPFLSNKEEGLKVVLDHYYNDIAFKELLEVYFNNDLNVLSSANNLYIHRNTLLYKLNNFYEHTGFNLKHFKDAATLYFYFKC